MNMSITVLPPGQHSSIFRSGPVGRIGNHVNEKNSSCEHGGRDDSHVAEQLPAIH